MNGGHERTRGIGRGRKHDNHKRENTKKINLINPEN